MSYKVKKGDVIAVELTHSCHSIGMKRTEWKDWTLCRAARVSRKGIVEAFTIGNTDQPGTLYSVDSFTRVAFISDDVMRAAATRLLALRGYEPFETADELKDAIRAIASEAVNVAA